jgi:hypothetical protein
MMMSTDYEADSNATLVDSFGVLVNSLNSHANDLKDVSQLRHTREGIDHNQVVALEQRIRVMEHTMKRLHSYLRDEADAIAGVKNLRSVVQEHTTQIQKICSNLPEHLPQQQLQAFAPRNNGAATATTSNSNTATAKATTAFGGSSVGAAKENCGDGGGGGSGGVPSAGAEDFYEPAGHAVVQRPVRKTRQPAFKWVDSIPMLRYLTVDEFSAVPGYVRGRLALNKVGALSLSGWVQFVVSPLAVLLLWQTRKK